MTTTVEKTVTFIAPKNPDLRVVKSPGIQRRTQDGIVYETVKPVDAIFEDHSFETDDPVLIEWLRNHPDNFANAGGEERFMEEGFDEPKPSVAEQVERLHAAAATNDEDEILEVLKLEEDTHNRASVLDVGKALMLARNAKEEGATSE